MATALLQSACMLSSTVYDKTIIVSGWQAG
jgi:hypothetical protein